MNLQLISPAGHRRTEDEVVRMWEKGVMKAKKFRKLEDALEAREDA